MDEINNYMWLVKTNRGDFFISVSGKWTEHEAEVRLRGVFKILLKLDIVSMTPRKRATGPMDNHGTIYEDADAKSGLGFSFIAGKKIWEAAGRLPEYEVQMKPL